MHWFAIPLSLALASGVSPENLHQRQNLMDQIEKTIVLPKNAEPLGAYGQNYAYAENAQVIAVYLIPEPLYGKNWGCVHGNMKPCTKGERQRVIDDKAKRRAAYASAGERRWFENESELPSIADGGCAQITARYDIPTKRILYAGCNGR